MHLDEAGRAHTQSMLDQLEQAALCGMHDLVAAPTRLTHAYTIDSPLSRAATVEVSSLVAFEPHMFRHQCTGASGLEANQQSNVAGNDVHDLSRRRKLNSNSTANAGTERPINLHGRKAEIAFLIDLQDQHRHTQRGEEWRAICDGEAWQSLFFDGKSNLVGPVLLTLQTS